MLDVPFLSLKPFLKTGCLSLKESNWFDSAFRTAPRRDRICYCLYEQVQVLFKNCLLHGMEIRSSPYR